MIPRVFRQGFRVYLVLKQFVSDDDEVCVLVKRRGLIISENI
jgi:hypothetical protein